MAQTPAKVVKDQHGLRIDYTASGTIETGDVLIVGSMILVATADAVSGDVIALAGPGHIIDLPKTSTAIPFGNTVAWSASGTPYVGDSSSGAASHATGTRAGRCVLAAGATDTYVRTLLEYAIS